METQTPNNISGPPPLEQAYLCLWAQVSVLRECGRVLEQNYVAPCSETKVKLFSLNLHM